MVKSSQRNSAVTLEDVAKAVGMSVSTVSRTFTPGASVGQNAKSKILAAARELGYRPNAIARTLSTKKSRIVALVVSYLHNQFYPTIIERLCKLLEIDGFHVLLFVNEETVREQTHTDDLLLEILGYQVDGIILASSLISSRLAKRCHDSATPVVMFNRISKVRGVSTVASDNYAGGLLAAKTLLDRGAKRIGFIAGVEQASTSIERERGFRDGLAQRRRALDARECGDYDLYLACDAARRMFNNYRSRPDAVFVANDHMAFGVMDVIRNELGLSVPYDVQVIGFDNVPQSAWQGYALTTLEQDADSMCKAAISQLLRSIHQKKPARARHITVPVRLIARQTTKEPKYPASA